MDPSTPIFKSKLRKRFYRKYDLHLGDLIRSSEGNVGGFYGLSTKGIGLRLTVLYQPYETMLGTAIKELPQTFEASGIEVKVAYEPV